MNRKYVVYILESLRVGRYYVGSSGNVEERLKKHNSDDAGWTRRYQPWKLIYTEEYETRGEAVRRERFLKSKEGISEKLRILEAVKRNPYG
jgi:putative endonuclease